LLHLFTDFGWSGPYVGEMKAVLAREVAELGVIDLMHDAPAFNPMASAYLLAALSRRFVAGDICLGVVDPGVGDAKRRVLIVEVDGIQFVGPDNGLFAVLGQRAKQVNCREVRWRPQQLSASFHGRDVFAPIAAGLQSGRSIDAHTVPVDSMVGCDYPDQLAEVIYVDHYGNVVTGLSAERYSAQTMLSCQGRRFTHAETFSKVAPGEIFWYGNSMGLIELAANQASACELLALSIGSPVLLET
jgi:S-adenosylmethionine hydrolase